MHSTGSGPQMSSQIGTPMRTPLNTIGPGDGPGREHALFVEDAVVRQVDLEAHGLDPALVSSAMALCSLPSSTQGRPTSTAGPPSAVSRASASQAARQASWKAGFSTRSSGG